MSLEREHLQVDASTKVPSHTTAATITTAAATRITRTRTRRRRRKEEEEEEEEQQQQLLRELTNKKLLQCIILKVGRVAQSV